VIQLRHRQPSLWHSGLAKDIEDLWEPWMKEVDQLLEDAALVEVQSIRLGQLGRASERFGILTIMALLAKILIRGAEYGPRPCVACR
jgi:hypothetical protein